MRRPIICTICEFLYISQYKQAQKVRRVFEKPMEKELEVIEKEMDDSSTKMMTALLTNDSKLLDESDALHERYMELRKRYDILNDKLQNIRWEWAKKRSALIEGIKYGPI